MPDMHLTARSARPRYGRARYADWKGVRFTGRPPVAWQPPRDEGEESARLYGWKPRSQVYMAMSPQRFIALSKAIWQGGHRLGEPYTDDEWRGIQRRLRERNTAVAERMRRGEALDAAFLDYDQVQRRFTAQEGAHRATAAIDHGLAEIPVIVFVKDGHNYTAHTDEILPATIAYLRTQGTVLSVGGSEE